MHNDTTSWTMDINRKYAWFKCGYAKIIIDRNNRFDAVMESPRVCNEGDSITWSGVVTYSNTQSARFYMCKDFFAMPDSCEYLQWIPKR